MFIVGEVLKGLIFAHELQDGYGTSMNLIHRDVNPANVFVSYQGGVKLGDFGIAKIALSDIHETIDVKGVKGRESINISQQELSEVIEPRMKEILQLAYSEIKKSEFENKLNFNIIDSILINF